MSEHDDQYNKIADRVNKYADMLGARSSSLEAGLYILALAIMGAWKTLIAIEKNTRKEG